MGSGLRTLPHLRGYSSFTSSIVPRTALHEFSRVAVLAVSYGPSLSSNMAAPRLSSHADASSKQPPEIIDDKSPHCIPFILSHLSSHQTAHPGKPFFIGLNGVQGAGKTTLVSTLASTLREKEGLETLVTSIDDLYLTHDDQVALAKEHADNPLVQHRGEPGRFPSLSFLGSELACFG
jgi:hypothetical protein